MKEELIVALSADIKDLKANLDKANNTIKGFSDNAGSSVKKSTNDFSQLGGAASKLGGMLAGAFAVGGMISFGKSVIDTTAQFQKFEAVLSNTLGSNSAAQMAMDSIVEFASKTPFQVDELTGAFVKLANQGFKPTMAEMKSLGDLAASTGKSFDQLAEGILDAQTGEFERLKEFGIKAKDMGDKVQFTFKGVKTEVDKTSDAMKNYIVSLGNANGVTGAMDKISKTLGGQISNLSDNWTTLMKNLGDSNTGVMSKTVDYLNQMLGVINKIGKADNLTDKLGIDQRGKSFYDNIPFAELQNLWGGNTVGQQANMKLADTYDEIGKKIQEASASSVKLQNLKAEITKQRDALASTNPLWKIYNQRIIDSAEALKALTAERQKVKDAKGADVVNTNSLAFATSEIKRLNDEIFKTNVGTSRYDKLNKELDIAIAKLKELEHQALVSRIGKDITQAPSMDEQFARSMEVDLSSLEPAKKNITDTQAAANLLFGAFKNLEVIGGTALKPIQIGLENTKNQTLQLGEAVTTLFSSFAMGATAAFESAISGTQTFAQAFGQMIKQMIIKLAAALAVAALLAIAVTIATGGTNMIGGKAMGFKEIFALTSGINLNGGGGSKRVNTGVTNNNQGGSVEFEIRGDKLYGVLQNYSGRLDRLV
jgi:CII-binding regulator of phage lambda lysogenization HflD